MNEKLFKLLEDMDAIIKEDQERFKDPYDEGMYIYSIICNACSTSPLQSSVHVQLARFISVVKDTPEAVVKCERSDPYTQLTVSITERWNFVTYVQEEDLRNLVQEQNLSLDEMIYTIFNGRVEGHV